MKNVKQFSLIIGLIIVCFAVYYVYTKANRKNLEMSFRIENSFMPFKFVQCDIKNGAGKITCQKYGSKDIKTLKISLSPQEIQQVSAAFDAADFFNIKINDLNKDKILVTDVGTTTLKYINRGKKRVLSYGFVEDKTFNNISGVFWKLTRERLAEQGKK